MTALVALYCTFPDADTAATIGRTLVEERLAACINILAPCRSIYRWQGAVEQADEVPALLKTSAATTDRLIARLAELHPYEVPAIAVWPVAKALAGYADWVHESVDQP